MENKQKIIDIFSTILDKQIDEKCSRDSEELWDSMAHIELIVTIEEEFGVKIPQELISELTSIENILEALEKLC